MSRELCHWPYYYKQFRISYYIISYNSDCLAKASHFYRCRTSSLTLTGVRYDVLHLNARCRKHRIVNDPRTEEIGYETFLIESIHDS